MTGTYLDMTANLPVVDPTKVQAPGDIALVRGEYDGIATVEDLFDFYRQLPHGDKQLVILPNTAHSVAVAKTQPPFILATAVHGFLDNAGTDGDLNRRALPRLKLRGEKLTQARPWFSAGASSDR